jgi:hypothetical protein
VLYAQARVDSARDLDAHGRRQVIDHLESLLARGRKIDGTPPRNMSRPLVRKIAAQLAASGKSWHYATGIARKMFGKANLDWCTDDELHRIVAALVIHATRAARNLHTGAPTIASDEETTTTPREGQ